MPVPVVCRSHMAPLGCSVVARLQRWFRGLDDSLVFALGAAAGSTATPITIR